MIYQFRLNESQLRMIVEALNTKSAEFASFSQALIQNATQQLESAQQSVNETADVEAEFDQVAEIKTEETEN